MSLVPSPVQGKSIRSFPSGHSSMSMTGTLYVTLVCWGDVSRFAADHRGWRRSLLVGWFGLSACVLCTARACCLRWPLLTALILSLPLLLVAGGWLLLLVTGRGGGGGACVGKYVISILDISFCLRTVVSS